jgi:protein-tyrosine phosphatase
VIDLHCHVLPGIDDGPRTIEESVALARAAALGGTRTIVATPHASAHYPNRPATIHELVGQLGERLAAEDVAIEIRPGAEVAMSQAEEIEPHELAQMTLGGGPWLLLEPPFLPVVLGLDRVIARLQGEGYGIVLAHPERCPAFHREPQTLRALVEGGVLTSITAGSLTGRFGKEVKRFATKLLAEELVHNVASDAHDPLRRRPSIAAELQRAGLSAMAGWLTEAVPNAILAGEQLPARPTSPPAPRRRWLRPA